MSETATLERSYTTVDKSGWRRGAWDDEPDKGQWVDEETGLDCLIVRNRGGALCGYVGVPPAHPWHGIGYSRCIEDRQCEDGIGCDHTRPDERIEVHGGLTYSDACQEGRPESEGICHLPFPGRPEDVWWFGFDCAHSGDLSPAYADRLSFGDGVYRGLSYVRAQVASLARQLAAVQARR